MRIEGLFLLWDTVQKPARVVVGSCAGGVPAPWRVLGKGREKEVPRPCAIAPLAVVETRKGLAERP